MDDPYELFNTPPMQVMQTSTPARKREPKKCNISLSESTPIRKKPAIKKLSKKKGKQQSSSLWDKALKADPNLKQYVEKFNESLETALSKPLDGIKKTDD